MKRLFAILLFCVLVPCVYGETITHTFDNGDRYVGEAKNGNLHGQGTYTWANGTKYVGEFKNSKKWNGIEYLASGQVAGTFKNGNWCKGCKPESTATASSSSISEANKEKYIDWAKPQMPEFDVALAAAANGAWGYAARNSVYEAKETALTQCRKYSNGQSCNIIDVNLTSINQGQSSTSTASNSTSSTSSSKLVWCATAVSAIQTTKDYCKSRGGKVFSTESQAKVEHKRLKGGSSSSSTTTASSSSLPPCPTGIWHKCFGTYTFDDGYRYIGEWRDDKFHGQGTLTYASNGDRNVGEWKNGEMWSGVGYDANGAILGTVTNGKFCKGCKPESTATASNSTASNSTALNSSYVWCATQTGKFQTTKDYCKSRGGKVFSTESQAKAEQQGLKGGSSSSSTTTTSNSTALNSGSKNVCSSNPPTVSSYRKDWVWCATEDGILVEPSGLKCRQLGGIGFSHDKEGRQSAVIEYNRLYGDRTVPRPDCAKMSSNTITSMCANPFYMGPKNDEDRIEFQSYPPCENPYRGSLKTEDGRQLFSDRQNSKLKLSPDLRYWWSSLPRVDQESAETSRTINNYVPPWDKDYRDGKWVPPIMECHCPMSPWRGEF